ncbi:probable serine racemase [Dendronephthya gigantea]|uniref:probable serine racemase n=1 Tax=Dendronephthya gigantea TaxID=151771 RepID=UPI00106D26D2|nr:probable serine racemase [Dendronephthya gigantea]
MSARVALKDVQEASKRIAPYIHRTPIMTCSTLDEMAGKSLFFKCEIFQKVGAFKFRGASNAVGKLVEECKEDKSQMTIVTHSSGNHAQAIALASKLRGVKAHIVMPSDAPSVKKEAVMNTYGAQVTECINTQKSREGTCADVLKSVGANGHLIHPFDNLNVIAGQGTIGLEVLEQVPDVEAIVVPVGGGGLLSGVCVAVKNTKPDVKIFAAEPLNADDCAKSFAAKKRIPLPGPPDTIADGLRTSVGQLTWPIIQQYVDDVITVTEEEIIHGTRLVIERMKVVIEPSSGVVVAAVLNEKFRKRTAGLKNIAVLLCGGNMDFDKFPPSSVEPSLSRN